MYGINYMSTIDEVRELYQCSYQEAVDVICAVASEITQYDGTVWDMDFDIDEYMEMAEEILMDSFGFTGDKLESVLLIGRLFS